MASRNGHAHILAATRKGLFTLERDGASWRIARVDFLGDNCSMAMYDPRSGTTYCALEHGHFGVKLHRRTKGAAAFEEIPAPAFPPKPDGIIDTDGFGKPIPWSTVKVWALEPGGPAQDGLIWCGTIPGALFSSSDHGDTWQLNRALWDEPKRQKWLGGGADLPGIHSILVDPRDPDIVRLGISCGGVWVTRDGGRTFTNEGTGMWADHMPPEAMHDPNIQDVHCIAQCKAEPNHFWVQHHNAMFHSVDDAQTWIEFKDVKPAVFGFVVVAHPHDRLTAWYVPAIKDEQRIPVDGRFVVTRTRDGGHSFETLSRGLPQTPAYDLVYRHGLAVSDSGNELVVGSTSGGLWVSEDQGDNWSEAPMRLPPIHAVRFVTA